jgi:hypothetical protein
MVVGYKASMQLRALLSTTLGLLAFACGGDDDGGGGTGGSAGSSGGSAGSSGSSAGTAGSSGGSSGAGGSGATSSSLCDGVVGYCRNETAGHCSEYGGTRSPESFTAFEESCKMDQANTWSVGPCPRDGAVGACLHKFDNGPCSAILFYPPQTAADGEQTCTAAQGTWTTSP